MGGGAVKKADALAELERALRAKPPPAVTKLPTATVADLAAAMDDARRKQGRALAEALDSSLSLAPWPVRGVLKKVLVP